ncbi:MAG: hypothetical protein ACRDXF_05530, partial [Acidimicrobiia bacterium]
PGTVVCVVAAGAVVSTVIVEVVVAAGGAAVVTGPWVEDADSPCPPQAAKASTPISITHRRNVSHEMGLIDGLLLPA